jgi:hypothetical protein
MTATWTMDQVAQVRGLRVTGSLSREVIHTSEGQAVDVLGQMLAAKFVTMAHPFGVEVHPGDLVYVVSDDPAEFWTVRLKTQWNPSTHDAELRGGPQDGMVMVFQRIGPRMNFPVLDTAWSVDDAQSATATMTSRVVSYDLTGWNESERRWVYEATA